MQNCVIKNNYLKPMFSKVAIFLSLGWRSLKLGPIPAEIWRVP